MFEQVVEQEMTDIRVLPGMTVAVERRRQWTSMSMAERRRRRMLTKPVSKKQAEG